MDEAQTLAAQISSRIAEKPVEITPNELELTEEETEAVLKRARKEKAIKFREEQYWKKVTSPREYNKYDKKSLWNYIIRRGKDLIPDFEIDEQIKPIMGLLNLYFAQDESFCEKAAEYTKTLDIATELKFSLNKGLLLFGPVGCGKTTIMRLFSVNPNSSFSMVSSRKVAADYVKKDGGEELIDELYCDLIPVYAHQYFGQTEIGTCFDDLGTEQNKAHFSNKLNVMEYVLLNRYDNFRLKGKTHVTTNLTISQIEEQYGERVKSRVMEMFNFIIFNPNAIDRRS